MNSKRKNILLIIGFSVLLFICFKLALVKTLDLKKEYQELKSKEKLFENLPKQLALLNRKQVYYDSLLVTYQRNSSSVQNNLLQTINSFADSSNIKVIQLLKPHTVNNNELKINSFQFSLAGNYNNVIKLVHNLEQKSKFGEIVNLHLEKKKDFRTGKYYLQAHLILRSFE